MRDCRSAVGYVDVTSEMIRAGKAQMYLLETTGADFTVDQIYRAMERVRREPEAVEVYERIARLWLER